jgi:hypothetical protein
MKEIIFVITEDDVDGGFTAKAHWADGNRDIVTEGDSREELLRNIRDNRRRVRRERAQSRPDPFAFCSRRGDCPMKLPRNLSGDDVVKGLRRIGYEQRRQPGGHVTFDDSGRMVNTM